MLSAATSTTYDDGAVGLNDGTRLLPYLGVGSGGIALVLRHFLLHPHDERFAAELNGNLIAAQAQFVVQRTLFNGRASMIAPPCAAPRRLLGAHRAGPHALSGFGSQACYRNYPQCSGL